MTKPRSRKRQLLAIVGGRAVCVTELLSLELRRVRAEVLPVYRAQGDRGELDAWFANNAMDRAQRALERRRVDLVVRCYVELQRYRRDEAQA